MDDLLDLNFTSPSVSNSNTTKTQPYQNGNSSFDYLSATVSRPTILTPQTPAGSTSRASSKNLHGSRSAGAAPSDAFDSLFGTNKNTNQKSNEISTMTMSERLKAAEIEKQQKLSGALFAGSIQSHNYASRSLGPSPIMRTSSGSSFHTQSPLRPVAPPLAPSRQSSQPSQVPSIVSADPWDLDFLESSSRTVSPGPLPSRGTTPPPFRSRKNSWDLDFDTPKKDHTSSTDLEPQRSARPPARPTPSTQPSSLSLLGDEFGPLEASQSGSVSLESDSEDVLGLLGAPIPNLDHEQIKRDAAKILRTSPGLERQRVISSSGFSGGSRSNGTASPPPHIMGKVVEMGFSIPQSRQALNQTRNSETGEWDVGAAVESLLTGQNELPEEENSRRPSSITSETDRLPSQPRAPPNRRREDTRSTETSSSLVNAKEIQDQATELLAQASAYSSTALGKAASFWKQSKASLTKVIEDQTTSSEGGNMKPKWMKDMQQAISGGESSPSEGLSPMSPFSDHAGPSNPSNSTRMRPTPRDPSPQDRRPPEPRQPYVSSARRKVAERHIKKPTPDRASSSSDLGRGTTTSDAFSSLGPELIQSLPLAQPVPKPKPSTTFNFPSYPIVNISQSQITLSLAHRNKGNEWFKQGQYSNAEQAYTQALDLLQEAVTNEEPHNAYFGCLPILNNRATARLKNGDSKGAREDVNRVIDILLCEKNTMKEESVEYLIKLMEFNILRIPNELKNQMNFDINEQLGKALSKRAKIKEEEEKWDEAKIDWELCKNLGSNVIKGAGGIKLISEGLTRCMKANQVNNVNSTKSFQSNNYSIKTSNPRTTKPINNNNNNDSNVNLAIKKLRESNEKAELEINQRLELKDSIDNKIENWKLGKESNLRGLIFNLDLILWDSLNWKKVKMSELLSENQVKINYIKAISKVHPDKIPKDATLEEQMIAKSVFATLNEAWIAMQG
ncbi:hypothetical protein CROQUDRAFT_723418 [Cronartium quercuum f. sp. fusiforme G11]|uniref:UBA domain-containing protein n=1 Tax=Cronartium quercuum f. sp. fusiforme G11 TaxID=708437 RepID=A0A9P6NKY9_9BASI|nr:hypothetical protein CROQUDRAFT_723418 [Cronartium quercuum f. sp. fusiforme G11]